MMPRALAPAIDLFCHYRKITALKVCILLFPGQENIILCNKRLRSEFVECTRTPASLGHFKKVSPRFKGNIMIPY